MNILSRHSIEITDFLSNSPPTYGLSNLTSPVFAASPQQQLTFAQQQQQLLAAVAAAQGAAGLTNAGLYAASNGQPGATQSGKAELKFCRQILWRAFILRHSADNENSLGSDPRPTLQQVSVGVNNLSNGQG